MKLVFRITGLLAIFLLVYPLLTWYAFRVGGARNRCLSRFGTLYNLPDRNNPKRWPDERQLKELPEEMADHYHTSVTDGMTVAEASESYSAISMFLSVLLLVVSALGLVALRRRDRIWFDSDLSASDSNDVSAPETSDPSVAKE